MLTHTSFGLHCPEHFCDALRVILLDEEHLVSTEAYMLAILACGDVNQLVLIVRVLDHSSPCEMFPGPPYDQEIFVTVGVSGAPVTLEDITRALLSIPGDAWQQGRSYYWEGVVLSPDGRRAHIRWGS